MADLRALMKERKAASKRIDHPYARYSNAGQLSCSLCHLAVKNEVLWPAHLTSKVHRQNVRQQQIAEAQAEAEAEAQLEASSRSSSAVVGGGTKRGAEDVERAGLEDEEAAGPAKRVRWEDEQHDDETPSVDAASGSSSLPPGFFDDPSKAPTFETSQSADDNDTTAIPPAPEDDEMAEFEAFLAQEEPEASTSAAGPTVFSAQATITADEVLFNNDEDEEGKANGDQADEEEEDDENKETEEERQAREEREELMERIEQEEREQREADERVESLKKRLLAVRAAKKAGSGILKSNGEPQTATHELEETARERRRRRLGK